jgi:hypothetical protein
MLFCAHRLIFDENRWRGTTCIPARDLLCHLRSSESKFVSRLFPNHPRQVFLTQRDSALLPEDVARMLVGRSGTMTCPEIQIGRTAITPLDHSVPHHDISLCNIVGMGSDYLFVPFQSRVYVLVDPVGIPALVLLSILTVAMMIILGHNLQVPNSQYQMINSQMPSHSRNVQVVLGDTVSPEDSSGYRCEDFR